MEYTILQHSAFKVVGLRKRYAHGPGEIPALWQEFVPRMAEITNRAGQGVSYGVMGNFDPQTNTFDYQAAIPVSGDAPLPEGMVAWSIPEQTYAVFKSTLQNIGETFGKIYGGWFEQSGYTRATGPEFEYYGSEFCPDKGSAVIYVWVPVVPKSSV